jgi:hypothetical protein
MLIEKVEKYNIPFKCKKCGGLDFPYIPINDKVFLFLINDIPEKVGSIYMVNDNYVGGSYVSKKWEPKAIVLAKGAGYYDKKGNFYNCDNFEVGDIVSFYKGIPDSWRNFEIKNRDTEFNKVIKCGYNDIWFKYLK